MNLSSENIIDISCFQQNPGPTAMAHHELPDQPGLGLQRARGQPGGGPAAGPQHPAGAPPQGERDDQAAEGSLGRPPVSQGHQPRLQQPHQARQAHDRVYFYTLTLQITTLTLTFTLLEHRQ